MTAPARLTPWLLVTLSLLAAGCRQRMADQPYYRPLDQTDFYTDGRSARPLERGVIHRGQFLETDALVTGLTTEEWGRAYAQAKASAEAASADAKRNGGKGDAKSPAVNTEDREIAIGSPRFDPPGFDAARFGGTPHPGPQVYVNEFPFPITKDDLARGQERFTIYCAVCHGPLGNGQGKIWERGYLTPTSFHTEKVGAHEVDARNPPDVPLGFSRGYGLWGIKIPMRDVPVGYYYEVITKGFGGMPSYSAQIPPADRWRIIAYVRVLQMSQHATPDLAGKPGGGGKP